MQEINLPEPPQPTTSLASSQSVPEPGREAAVEAKRNLPLMPLVIGGVVVFVLAVGTSAFLLRTSPATTVPVHPLPTVPIQPIRQSIISWNESNGGNIPSPGAAGVVTATNWNNSIDGMSLVDNSGTASGASFSISGSSGVWGIAPISADPDGDSTYNRTLLDGYANTGTDIGPEVFTIRSIPYSSYDLYVYFSSDVADRAGSITDKNSGVTYDFSTVGQAAISGANAVLTQTKDITGAYPAADYALFSGLTGSSDTITLKIPDGGGIAGFQIVARGSSGHP